jgi:cell shape-determining protein MreC
MVSSSGKINKLPVSHMNRIKLAEANQKLKEQARKVERLREQIAELEKENKKLKAQLAVASSD